MLASGRWDGRVAAVEGMTLDIVTEAGIIA